VDDILSSESEEKEKVDILVKNTNKNGILVDNKQLASEIAYVHPERPEVSKKKIMQAKNEVIAAFESCQVLLVNYIHTDYNFFLKKLLGYLQFVPPTLRSLIIPMPKGATQVDLYMARLVQSVLKLHEINASMTVLFISWESHQ